MPYKDSLARKEYQAQHYQKNKDKFRDRLRRRRAANSEFIRKYKDGKVCKYCPENDVACLEFHHINPEEKLYELSHMMSRGFSVKKIIDEIAKCDIICSNCHRKLHRNKRKECIDKI